LIRRSLLDTNLQLEQVIRIFASVELPAVQTNPFDLSFVWNGTTFDELLAPNTWFSFPMGGVNAFTVTGIDPSDGLDPANTTAFITGVTFVGDGTFTGTQTPITIDVPVPEPSSLVVLAGGLFGLMLVRCRRNGRPALSYSAL